MRTPMLVGSVIAIHCVAVGSVIMIQGCGTIPSAPVSEPKMPPRVSPGPDYVPSVPVIGPDIAPPVDSSLYVVRQGDSLSKIASRHGISTSELSALNKITNPNKIRVGQKLVVPGASAVLPAAPLERPRPAAKKPVNVEGPVYTVRSGDSLSVIAVAHGVKVGDIRDANGIEGDKIMVGQKLVIPGATKVVAPAAPSSVDAPVRPAAPKREVSSPAKAPAETPVSAPKPAAAGVLKDYTVEEGDDIFSVAMMWGVSVSRIREVNSLQQDEDLKVGQKIKIPLNE